MARTRRQLDRLDPERGDRAPRAPRAGRRPWPPPRSASAARSTTSQRAAAAARAPRRRRRRPARRRARRRARAGRRTARSARGSCSSPRARPSGGRSSRPRRAAIARRRGRPRRSATRPRRARRSGGASARCPRDPRRPLNASSRPAMPAIELTMPSGAPAWPPATGPARCAPRRSGRRRVQPAGARQLAVAERRERLRERDPVGVDEVALVVVEHAAHRAAAEIRRARSAGLPRAGTPWPRRCGAGRVARADRLGRVERQERAERAVEAPAVRRRVEVRPAPDLGQTGLAPRQPPDDVPGRVEGDVEPALAHPARHELEGPLLAGGESRTGWCRRRGRSRRACRAARGCARHATPASRGGPHPEWRRRVCSPSRVCQGAARRSARSKKATMRRSYSRGCACAPFMCSAPGPPRSPWARARARRSRCWRASPPPGHARRR